MPWWLTKENGKVGTWENHSPITIIQAVTMQEVLTMRRQLKSLHLCLTHKNTIFLQENLYFSAIKLKICIYLLLPLSHICRHILHTKYSDYHGTGVVILLYKQYFFFFGTRFILNIPKLALYHSCRFFDTVCQYYSII